MQTSTVTLPTPERPRVSVIVLAWRSAELLQICLRSLADQRPGGPSFETIVVLNGAVDAVVTMVDASVKGAHVVRSSVNLGFAGGCNRAARAAQGEFLVLLNDDAEVATDWLEALVRTAEDTPDAGAVGSRIASTDGVLLEAGSLLWRDGSITNVGRDLPVGTRRYRYRRTVDYCSASALLVRRDAWDRVGGFDDDFFPGYYEDVDLCLSIARLGQKVLFEPRAEVRHRESSSLGWGSSYKEFVASRNRDRFVGKRAAELSNRPPPATTAAGVDRAVHRARGLSRRALLVDEELAAGEVGPRSDQMIELTRQFMRRGYAVALFASLEHSGRAPSLYTALGDAGVEVLEEADLVRHLARPETMYDAVLAAEPGAYKAAAPIVRRHQPEAALVYVTGGPYAEPSGGLAPDFTLFPTEKGATSSAVWNEALDAARRARRLHNRNAHTRTFVT